MLCVMSKERSSFQLPSLLFFAIRCCRSLYFVNSSMVHLHSSSRDVISASFTAHDISGAGQEDACSRSCPRTETNATCGNNKREQAPGYDASVQKSQSHQSEVKKLVTPHAEAASPVHRLEDETRLTVEEPFLQQEVLCLLHLRSQACQRVQHDFPRHPVRAPHGAHFRRLQLRARNQAPGNPMKLLRQACGARSEAERSGRRQRLRPSA